MFAVLIHIVANMCKYKARKLINITNVCGLFVILNLVTSAVAIALAPKVLW